MSDEALEIAAVSILALACAHPVRVGIDGRSAAGKTTFRRDVAWMSSEATVRERYRTRWIPLHTLYEATGARSRASLIVDNEDPASPRVVA